MGAKLVKRSMCLQYFSASFTGFLGFVLFDSANSLQKRGLQNFHGNSSKQGPVS